MNTLNKRKIITEESLFVEYYEKLKDLPCPHCHTVGLLYLGSCRLYIGCLACCMYFAEEDFIKILEVVENAKKELRECGQSYTGGEYW